VDLQPFNTAESQMNSQDQQRESKTRSPVTPDPVLPGATESGSLVEEEGKETGSVKLGVYQTYWRAVGACLAPAVLLSLFLMQGELCVCKLIFSQ